MIKLFVLDVDGCVTFPFVTPNWESITAIRELQRRSFSDSEIPELTLLTGRPYPYAEAVAQWLDIRKPFIFESGGGLFDPLTHKMEFSAYFTEEIQEQQREIRKFVVSDLLPLYEGVNLEFTKKTDLGLVSLNKTHIDDLYGRAEKFVKGSFPEFEVHKTDVSINVICKLCNKGEGLRHISRYTGIPVEEMAYIGDSTGDLKALEIAGRPFAPANAIERVKQVSEVLENEATDGVLEAYRKIVKENGRAFKV